MADEGDFSAAALEAAANEADAGGGGDQNNDTTEQQTQETQTQETQQTQQQATTAWTDVEVPAELSNLYKVKNFGELQKFIAERDQKYRASSGEVRRIMDELNKLKAQQQQAPAENNKAQSSMGAFFGFRDQHEYNEAFKLDPQRAAQRVQEAILANAEERLEKKLAERFKPIEEQKQAMAFEQAKAKAWEEHPEFKPGAPWHEMIQSYWEQESNQNLAQALSSLNGMEGVNVPKLAGMIATYDLLKAQLATAQGKKMDKAKAAGVGAKPSTGGKVVPKQDSFKEMVAHAAAADGVDPDDAEAFAKRLERM